MPGFEQPRPLPEILEREWDRTVFSTARKTPGVATQLGWQSQWTFNSQGSRSGYPDRTVVRDRIIFVELKRELTGKLSIDRDRQAKPAQVEWLDRLARAGGEVYLWRPSDLDEIARILGKPWKFHRYADGTISFDKPPHLIFSGEPAWIPRSIWIPGAGRADEAGAV